MKKKVFDYAAKSIKESFMGDNKKNDKSKHADTVIRNHVIWSMGASFIVPIPIADVFAVSALQLDMIRQLCRVYDRDFSESSGKAIITSLTSSIMARAGARSLIKLIPGIGTVIGGVAVSVFNGASTYALGQVFKRHFDSGGTILDFDPERLKKMYNEQFEKGKKVAEQLRKDKKAQKQAEAFKTDSTEAATEADAHKLAEAAQKAARAEAMEAKKKRDKEILDRLKEAADLKDRGVLSDEEFEDLKQRLLSKFDE
ncbi:MAG TPA: DUF697 domain-containing protein [Saprospiraceae bacterium]|nr:DUF697 domain-containing protein [Saprospiraceae bacterium]